MRTQWKMLCAASAAVLLAGPSLAQQKTIPSQTLSKLQYEFEVRFDYSYLHASRYPIQQQQMEGEYTERSRLGSLYAGIGVWDGLQITATLPYEFSDTTDLSTDFAGTSTEVMGWEDLSAGAAYEVLGPKGPWSLATGLDVKFPTAEREHGGTGTTDFTPFVAASYNELAAAQPYAAYAATLRTNASRDTHTVKVGAQVPVAKIHTVDANVSASYNTADTYDTYWTYAAKLGLLFALNQHLYLTPTVRYELQSPADLERGDYRRGTVRGYMAGIGVYGIY